jgi:hypothetical protein
LTFFQYVAVARPQDSKTILVWKDEPETLGVLIADIARHVASALEKDTGRNKDDIGWPRVGPR